MGDPSSSPPDSFDGDIAPPPPSVEGLPPEQRLAKLERYADFFASSPDGLLVVDFTGMVLYCNQAACGILERPSHTLRDRSLGTFLDVDGRAPYAELLRAFSRGELPARVDVAFRSGSGQRRILDLTFNGALHEASSVVVGLRDVTDDRALERELTRTKEFLQRVIDSSADAIVSANMRGTVILFNPAAERLSGFSAAEAVGKLRMQDFYPEGVARDVMRRMRSSDHGGVGELSGFETEIRTKAGERVPVMMSAALIVHRGVAEGSVGVFTDLRSRHRMEASLADANRRLAEQEKITAVAELAGAAAHELNQPLTAIAGYAALLARTSEADPRTAKALHHIGVEVERMTDIVGRIGRITRYETKPYVGATRILDLERSADDVEVTTDARTDDLAQLAKLAELGRNVANVVHEVNNPLTAIVSYADGLASRLAGILDARDLERLTKISDAAARIQRFTRELIDYSRPAARAFAALDVHLVLERALELTAHLLRDADVTVDRAFGPLPPIDGMEAPLTQVFVNLFTNAAHAMAGRGGTLYIGTEVTEAGVAIDVADDGPGIAPENLARVFDPYFTTKPRGVGSGLGLSIVRQIVHEHGGQIRFHTCAPHGARFRIELPPERLGHPKP